MSESRDKKQFRICLIDNKADQSYTNADAVCLVGFQLIIQLGYPQQNPTNARMRRNAQE